jgi:murein DD-endopeptidase MepM/ murein hydrolase activator NlpD
MAVRTVSILMVLICTLLLSACAVLQRSATELPSISKPSYLELSLSNEDEFTLSLKNHLPVDRYVILRSEIDSVNTKLNTINPIQLFAMDSTSISLMSAVDSTSYLEIAESISGSALIGNPNTAKPDTSHLYRLPVGMGKSYRILQGANGSFTHNQPGNRYAVDFAMSVGDTVYAAREGVVAYLYEESTEPATF